MAAEKFALIVCGYVFIKNSFNHTLTAFKPYLCQDQSSVWRPALSPAPKLQIANSTSRVLYLIRQEKLYEKFGDFDDHLEDVSIDWLRNSECKDESFVG